MNFIVLILLSFAGGLQGFLLTRPLKQFKSIIYVKIPHNSEPVERNPGFSYDPYGEFLNSETNIPIQSNLENNIAILYNQSVSNRKSKANSALERYIEEFMGELDTEPSNEDQWINEARDIVEKERGCAIWSSRSEDSMKKKKNIKDNIISNIPSEVLIVISAVFIEKICTLAELKLSEELLYNEYKKWLRHEKMKLKKDPMPNIRLVLIQKWLEQQPSDRLGFIRQYYYRRARTRCSGILTRSSHSVIFDEYSTLLDTPPVVNVVPNRDDRKSLLQQELNHSIKSADVSITSQGNTAVLKGNIKASSLSSKQRTEITTTAATTASSSGSVPQKMNKENNIVYHSATAERVLSSVPSLRHWHLRDTEQPVRNSSSNEENKEEDIQSSDYSSSIEIISADIFTEDQMKWWLGVTQDYFVVL